MKKRILFSVTNDLSYDQRMIRICTTLSTVGYQVKLIGRQLPHSLPLSPQPFEQKRLYCFFQKGKFFYLEYNLRLFLYLLFHKADIICAIDLDTILPVLYTCKLKKKVPVYDAHEYFTEVPEVIRRPRIQAIWQRVARLAIPQFHYCYTVGPALAQILQEQYGPVFSIIRNVPVPMETIATPVPTEPFIILYQGVLNEGRGLEVAIEAMQDIPHAQLWLAGEGELSLQLRKQVQMAHLEDKVKFLGYLSPAALKEVTVQASLGLNLLENSGLSYYYSLANKAFDYIQSGLPSLQMDFPEYRHLQEKYGVFHLLKELNAKDVAASINNLRPGMPYYNILRENCLQARKMLHWEEEKKILIQFYEQFD